jgi:hypothetical protein
VFTLLSCGPLTPEKSSSSPQRYVNDFAAEHREQLDVTFLKCDSPYLTLLLQII